MGGVKLQARVISTVLRGDKGQVCAPPSLGLSGWGEGEDNQNLVLHSLTTWILSGLWDTRATTTPCLESEMRR